MRTFRHSFSVNAPIEKVWAFYTDIRHLDVITPKEMKLKILKITSSDGKLHEGTDVFLSGKIFGNKKWNSRITAIREGEEYVDEMVTGPFKRWKHVHAFRKVSDFTTEVTDVIEIELPYGFLGRVFEGYAIARLERTFGHRKLATKEALEEQAK